MKQLCLFVLTIMLLTGAKAQQAPNPDVEKLMLTSCPPFVLLNVQPTNIQRPSTPRDFIAGIQSAMVNNELQPNFAMEFNPFNWGDSEAGNNKFNATDYLTGGGFAAIKRNFAISLATSQSDTVVFGQLERGLGTGYGFRFTIVPGRVSKRVNDLYYDWELSYLKQQFLGNVKTYIRSGSALSAVVILDQSLNAALSSIDEREEFLPAHKRRLRRALTEFRNSYSLTGTNEQKTAQLQADENAFSKTQEDTYDLIQERKVPFALEGFTLELAAAGVTVFQNNKWENARHAKGSVWLTPSYRFDLSTSDDPDLIQSFDALAVIRYIWNDVQVDEASYADLGLKVQFNRNKWNASLEGVGRYASQVPAGINSNWTYSVLSSFSYTIQENLTLRFSFGSNFDGNTRTYTQPNDIVAIGGLSVGVF